MAKKAGAQKVKVAKKAGGSAGKKVATAVKGKGKVGYAPRNDAQTVNVLFQAAGMGAVAKKTLAAKKTAGGAKGSKAGKA